MLSRGLGAGLRERERGDYGEGERVRDRFRGVFDGDYEGARRASGRELELVGTRIVFDLL